jgi:hypothetical protein
LVILLVFVIMSMVLSFSIGVERGRKMISSQRQPGPETEGPSPSPVISVVTESVVQSLSPRRGQGGPGPGAPKIPSAGSPAVPIHAADTVVQAAQLIPGKAVLSGSLSGDPEGEAEKTVDNRHTIQVASFKKQEQAQREAVSLQKKGYESFVLAKGNYSIVCVGKFDEKKQAQVFSSKLKKTYKDCLVRRM